MNDDFYMILPSNGCEELSPRNSASKFEIKWMDPINLIGNWKVALVEFNCDYNCDTITQEQYISADIKSKKISVDIIDGNEYGDTDFKIEYTINNNKLIFKSKTHKFKILLKNKLEIIPIDISECYLNADNNFICEMIFPPDQINLTNITPRDFNFEIFYTPQIYYFPNNASFTDPKKLLQFIQRITNNLIFNQIILREDGYVSYELKENIECVKFGNGLNHILGFQNQTYTNRYNSASNIPDLNRIFSQFFIYIDIIQPIIVGDIKIPLLRTVVLDSNETHGVQGRSIIISPKNLIYLPVSRQTINRIEVNIRTNTGNLLPFTQNSSSSILLHFKKF